MDRLEVSEMWFHTSMKRITCTELLSNDGVLEKIETKYQNEKFDISRDHNEKRVFGNLIFPGQFE